MPVPLYSNHMHIVFQSYCKILKCFDRNSVKISREFTLFVGNTSRMMSQKRTLSVVELCHLDSLFELAKKVENFTLTLQRQRCNLSSLYHKMESNEQTDFKPAARGEERAEQTASRVAVFSPCAGNFW